MPRPYLFKLFIEPKRQPSDEPFRFQRFGLFWAASDTEAAGLARDTALTCLRELQAVGVPEAQDGVVKVEWAPTDDPAKDALQFQIKGGYRTQYA
jgi:hypothetical protein